MDALTPPAATATPTAGVAVRRMPLPYWLRHFTLIRRAAIIFAATAALTAAAVLTSYWKLHNARQAELRARTARDIARQSFVHVETEKQDIRQYQPLFTDLRRRGFIGAENRLDWVEAIRQIQEQRHLLPLTYDIDPQQPYKLAGPIATGDYQVRGSQMNVHMELLHEMDLINFLSDLRQRGVFTVQSCTIRRTPGTGTTALVAALTSDCTLNWVTLTPPVVPRQPGAVR